jgi:DNA-binding CsgD family transcriptional regulator
MIIIRGFFQLSGGCGMPLSAYDQTVAAIFDAALDERLVPAALQAVAEYVGVAGAAYLIVNRLTSQVSSATRWGFSTNCDVRDYLTHYGKIDPFRPVQEAAATGSLARLTESIPQRVLRHDEWYNDYLLKRGVRDVLDTKLHESPTHMVIIGLHCAVDSADPDPWDLGAVQALIPSLCKAASLHLGLIDIGYRSAIMRGGLDHVAAGVMFADKDGRIIETNHAAERILRLGDGLTFRNGKICARRSFETTKLAELIAQATADRPSAGCLLVGRDGGRPAYVVRVAPVGPDLAEHVPPMAMILVSAPDENRISEGELAELYGLSPAESRLAVALAFGKRLSELVGEFGVQITTLRTQLSSILKKCEVERQSDLVRLISNIPVVRLTSSGRELV